MKLSQSILSKLAGCLMLSFGLWAFPVHAQTDDQVVALVEAFRLAAPDTGVENDGLYSDWQVKPENVTSWSKFCKQPTTPEAFEADPELAKSIMTCVIADLLKEEYAASGNNIEVAVQRSASWWMTGDSTRYTTDRTISAYIQNVLTRYRAALQRPAN
jgi:hypothetical protein